MTSAPRSLIDHRKAEFSLFDHLAKLSAIASGLGLTEMVSEIEAIRSRIESHRFSLAVVGEFKRGKSTFINALLGKEILPADVTPTSATINRITYGLKKSASVIFKDGREQSVEVDKLAHYVTKLTPEAEALAATVREAVVTYPVPFCRDVDIIDTPGLSDDAAMTNVTLGILPYVDAAILVILATAPFAQSEAELLESLLVEHGLGSVIFVVTAIDRLPDPEKDGERIADTITKRIRERISQHATARFGENTEARADYLRRVGEPRVFGLSGYDALIGKVERDESLLARSRFPEFETFIESFLSEERGSVALRTHVERILGFCVTLEKALGQRLETSAASTWKANDSEPLEALLKALEWFLEQQTKRLNELQKPTHTRLQSRLRDLGQVLQKTTDDFFERFVVQAADLENGALVALVTFCRMRLNKELRSASAGIATEIYDDLKAQMLQAASGISNVAIAFDRVLRHVGKVLTPTSEKNLSMVERLAGPITRWREVTAESVLEATFNVSAHTRRATLFELLSPPKDWADAIAPPPNLSATSKGAKLVSVSVRTAKLKSDLKKGLSEELGRQLELSAGPRSAALVKEIDHSFDLFTSELAWALDQIQAMRARVRTEGERRLALAERQMEKVRESQQQVRDIQARCHQLARDINS